jgi:hypothetical protein
MRPVSTRTWLTAFSLALVAVGSVAAGAGARATGVHFTLAPQRALQGKPVVVGVTANPATASCSLTVRYSDGASQTGITATRQGKQIVWKWTVPDLTAPGPAFLTASCGKAGRASHRLMIVGTLIPPKIDVVKSGFSIRQKNIGSIVSYGVVLKNQSPNANALKVSVQVNFVMADNHLIGTATQVVPLVNAGSVYNLAGYLQFPGGAPVVKLEFVLIVGAREKAAGVHEPAVDNVHVVPQQYDPTWTGSVEGELINDEPSMNLRRSSLSAVLFDAAGNVVGGATGSALAVLPPGTRQVFKLSSGVDGIPFKKVASVAISTIPTYEQPTPT